MLKLEKKGKSLELHLWTSYQNKKKLIKAFAIALSCHALFFVLFVPEVEQERWQKLSPPIIAYVDEPPPEDE
jgi:hypothetical protein